MLDQATIIRYAREGAKNRLQQIADETAAIHSMFPDIRDEQKRAMLARNAEKARAALAKKYQEAKRANKRKAKGANGTALSPGQFAQMVDTLQQPQTPAEAILTAPEGQEPPPEALPPVIAQAEAEPAPEPPPAKRIGRPPGKRK